ncbi:MAG TPA: lipid-A-disaccharide synthase [Chitinophagaceae bacterium]|nr:lipid-A-disaccharide synthase [Chitinophagaceae bacterium]
MKYYIIAGEASGDLHGSNLVKAIKGIDDSAMIRCWGGDKMEAAGATLVKHYRDLAFMGFTEVLMNLRTIFRNLKYCKEDITTNNPDALILIDYPGFNLRIAKWAAEQKIKVIYYISPQVWAWKENRVNMMKKYIDKMLVILPFEKEYYKNKWNWNVEYVGHPLVEEVESFKAISKEESLSEKPIIALLPGSRKQEILKKLPVMLEVSKSFKEYQFIVAKAPGVDVSFYDDHLNNYDNVTYVVNKTYALLNQAKAALVTSGTATLETALFGVPEVVCYKGSYISYQIGRRLVKVKFISLVNLIMGRPIIKELIQDELTAKNLVTELDSLLNNSSKLEILKSDYNLLKEKLRTNENASLKAARSIVQFLRSTALSKE